MDERDHGGCKNRKNGWDPEPATSPCATVPDLLAWIGLPPGDRLAQEKMRTIVSLSAARPPSSNLTGTPKVSLSF